MFSQYLISTISGGSTCTPNQYQLGDRWNLSGQHRLGWKGFNGHQWRIRLRLQGCSNSYENEQTWTDSDFEIKNIRYHTAVLHGQHWAPEHAAVKPQKSGGNDEQIRESVIAAWNSSNFWQLGNCHLHQYVCTSYVSFSAPSHWQPHQTSGIVSRIQVVTTRNTLACQLWIGCVSNKLRLGVSKKHMLSHYKKKVQEHVKTDQHHRSSRFCSACWGLGLGSV